jgi:hypothetical protein
MARDYPKWMREKGILRHGNLMGGFLNLMCSEQKTTNERYRDNYDQINWSGDEWVMPYEFEPGERGAAR